MTGICQRYAHNISLISFILALSACGGGAGDPKEITPSENNTTPDTEIPENGGSLTQDYDLSGAAVKGPVKFAIVKLFELDPRHDELYDPASPVAIGHTDAAARIADLTVPRTARPPLVLVIETRDGIDINSGQPPIFDVLENVVTRAAIESRQPVYATPMTTLALQIARRNLSAEHTLQEALEAVDEAARIVSSTLGFGLDGDTDILTTPALLTGNSRDAGTQRKIAQYRAAIEATAAIVDNLARQHQVEHDRVLIELAHDLAGDRIIDGKDVQRQLELIDPQAFDTDPYTLDIPNTGRKVFEIKSILDEERATTRVDTPLDMEGVSIAMAYARRSADEDNDGILNIDEDRHDENSPRPDAGDDDSTPRSPGHRNAPSRSRAGRQPLPRDKWSVIYVDSQELKAEDGAAANALDGNPRTIWHTEYSRNRSRLPHEIHIDLGAVHRIDGLRYLARQDGSRNGMVADYALYVSNDRRRWGNPVHTGVFRATRKAQTAYFNGTQGRYVRFVAYGEVSGKIFTSAAELYLFGEKVTAAGRDNGTRRPQETQTERQDPPSSTAPAYLDKRTWRLVHTDSEETVDMDGRAIRAFDGDPKTFWHSRYRPSIDPMPHELVIDLGARYNIDTFRYLPRQDRSVNGTIVKWEFFISDDPGNWGNPVAKGRFAANKKRKAVNFTATSGRYVRFVGLREQNGRRYVSMAEFDIRGTLIDPAPRGDTKRGRTGDTGSQEPTGNPRTRSDSSSGKSNSSGNSTRSIGTRPDPNAKLLPQARWRLRYVDSEETRSSDGKAVNAFDGRTSTIWHSRYSPRRDRLPHEIQIDLGERASLSGFQYVPRQDGSVNGVITRLKFYVSDDPDNWGEPVAAGTLAGNTRIKQVDFAPVKGRYIRLQATAEINNRPFTTIAELRLIGRFEKTAEPAPEPSGIRTANQTTGKRSTADPQPVTVKTENQRTSERGPAPKRNDQSQADNRPVDWMKLIREAAGNISFVSTQSEFNSAASRARPGDVIIVRNGKYQDWNLSIASRGTAERPIVYVAQTPNNGKSKAGGVTFTGGFKLEITGDYNIIGGFIFDRITVHDGILFNGASNNRFSDNQFYDSGSTTHSRIIGLHNNSNRNRLDHNIMVRNRSFGMTIVLPRDYEKRYTYSHDNRFDHNVFRDIPTRGGKIPIQIGQHANEHTLDETRTLVDHNEFINCNVTNVNSKSNKETYLYNKFINAPTAVALALRAGNNKYVDGNYFENISSPMRVYGTDHTIVNNIIRDSRYSIQIPSWGDYTVNSGAASPSGPTGRLLVAHNTIVDSISAAIELGRIWGYTNRAGYLIADNAPFDSRFINNIFVGSQGVLFRNKNAANVEIRRNLYYPTGKAKAGDVGNDAIVADPRLDTQWRPQAGSPAIGRADYLQWVQKDFLGKSRGSTRNIGAMEAAP